MKFINLILILLFINEIACLSRALYYGKEKCFYDNYYSQMNIVITYKILDKDIKVTPGKTLFRIYINGVEKLEAYKMFYGTKLHGKFSYSIEESENIKYAYQLWIKNYSKIRNFCIWNLRFNHQTNYMMKIQLNQKIFRK